MISLAVFLLWLSFAHRCDCVVKSRRAFRDTERLVDDGFCSFFPKDNRHTFEESELNHTVDDGRCNDRNPLRYVQTVTKSTKYGTVRGRMIKLCDGPGVEIRNRPGQPQSTLYKTVNVFLGIPYARPPTKRNNLQFKLPEKPDGWPSVLDAINYRRACPQNEKYLGRERGVNQTDEDCLYLNIYVPYESTPIKKYPVMVYIHGGDWDHGAANTFPGHMLAASQSVIVVTFNYRLGHLGFLATGDHASPGNYGMFDQILALTWVYENIEYFDGDPGSITLFGMGAGAASAGLLAISPRSKEMVQRVIAQNGAPVADWAAIESIQFMINTTEILGEALGCSSQDSNRFVECIGQRSKHDIGNMEIKPRVGWLPWGPVVDNFTRRMSEAFLPKSPNLMLEDGVLFRQGFAYMTGVTKDEGINIFLKDCNLYKRNYEVTKDAFNQKIREFMRMYNYSVNADGIFSALNFMYTPPANRTNEAYRQGFIDLLTDRYYVAPNDIMTKLLLKNNVPTYMYVLNYTLEGYYRPKWQGVSTETEYLLLTGAPFLDPALYPPYLQLESAQWTDADRDMSQFFMEAWANFAKEGNPTPRRLFNTIYWPPMTMAEKLYIELNSTDYTSTPLRDYRNKECQFFNCYFPFLIDREPPTLAPTLEPGYEEIRLYTSALWGSVASAALFLIITVVCCILYCRARRYDSY